jgi:D-inositol-3-phosphate glycosyltransferase
MSRESPVPRARLRVALVVPALEARGGLAALALFLHRTLCKSGRYEPHLISLATSSRDRNSVRLTDPRTWLRGVRMTADEVAGLPFLHVGAPGSEVEPLRYQPRRALTELLNEFDIVQLVGGSPAFAHVARHVRRPVTLYVATLAKGERRALLRQTGLAPRWRRLLTVFVSRMDFSGLRYADVVFVINTWMYDLVARVLGADRVHLSPPGIDTTLFQPGEAHRNDTILAVGRLDDPRKNLPLLVAAFAEVRKQTQRSIRLVLAGERPPTEAVWERARSLGVTDAIDVRLALPPAELVALYQEATVFAVSSDEEGLGIAALEAMACGVPVVATRCGGPDVTVVDGATGLLVPVGDSHAFAACLKHLLDDADLRDRMGRASRARVEESFSLRTTGDVFLRAYDALLAQSSSAPARDASAAR